MQRGTGPQAVYQIDFVVTHQQIWKTPETQVEKDQAGKSSVDGLFTVNNGIIRFTTKRVLLV